MGATPTLQQLVQINLLLADVTSEKLTSLLSSWRGEKVIFDYWLQDFTKAEKLITLLEWDVNQ